MKQPNKCTLVGVAAWETISDCVRNAGEKMLIDHTCLVLPGRYQEKIPINGAEGLTIRGVYGEEKPVIDGTVELHPKYGTWTDIDVVDDKDTLSTDDDEIHLACTGEIDSALLDEYREAFGFGDDEEIHPFQLFFKQDEEFEMMINARWPNAGWMKDTMMPPKWKEHEHITNKFAKDGVPKVFYNDFMRKWTHEEGKTDNVIGAFIDGNRNVEGCKQGNDCGSLLKDKNIDLTDAMVVLGINWWDSYHRRITGHSPGSDTFHYQVEAEYPSDPTKPDKDKIKPHKDGTKYHQYYVDSLLSLMDTPWEWNYDMTNRILSFVPPKGTKSCSEIQPSAIRGRVINYAMEFESTKDLTMKDLEFFASAIYAEGKDELNDIDGITLDSIDFQYPGTNRRMLKEDSIPKPNLIMSYEPKGRIVIENCKFYGSDSAALIHRGNDTLIKNNEFKYNDWSGPSVGNNLASKATLRSQCKNGRKIEFSGENITQNTFLYGGATQAISPCPGSTVSENLVVGTRHGNLKADGASINVGKEDLKNIRVEKNWVLDSTNLGIRVDGGGPGKPAGEQGQAAKEGCQLNKRMHLSKNVAWKVGGYNIKGDDHKVDGNLALDMLQQDKDVVEPDLEPNLDHTCTVCRGMKGMKMPFVRKNGCRTDENGVKIPCIQNENSELTNNAFMFANGDSYGMKFDEDSICLAENEAKSCKGEMNEEPCKCDKNKELPTKGQGFYRIHAGKKNENNYYGDYSFDCGEQYGTGDDDLEWLGWKSVLNGNTYSYHDENDLYDPRDFLDYFVDICSYDFRPDISYENNPLTATGAQIGPYPTEFPKGKEYYAIAGRREEKASFPIPDHQETVLLRKELMFRPAYGCEKHKIYVGNTEDELKHVGTLRKGKNVYKGKFEAGKTYYWRVDCLTGEEVQGDVWKFTLVDPNSDDAKLLTKTRCMKEIEP